MAYDPNNIFAKIIAGEMPCHKVYEDAHTLSFLDIFPQGRGHALVMPKRAGEMVFDTDLGDLQHAIATVQKIARAMRQAWRPDGITIMQFNGAESGQTVFHLHYHVIPRFKGVALGGHGGKGQADEAELKRLAAELAAHLEA